MVDMIAKTHPPTKNGIHWIIQKIKLIGPNPKVMESGSRVKTREIIYSKGSIIAPINPPFVFNLL